MLPMPKKPLKTAEATRRRINLWAPLLFSGIQITHLSEDYTHCRARLRHWHLTKNSHGSQFGGSLFALTDPIYAMMLNCIFGDKHYVWDKAASIDYIKPGYGAVYLDCRIDPQTVAEIRERTASGDKYLPEFTIRLFDDAGETVAEVKRTVYLRLKKEYRP